jgi:hypothetical protein
MTGLICCVTWAREHDVSCFLCVRVHAFLCVRACLTRFFPTDACFCAACEMGCTVRDHNVPLMVKIPKREGANLNAEAALYKALGALQQDPRVPVDVPSAVHVVRPIVSSSDNVRFLVSDYFPFRLNEMAETFRKPDADDNDDSADTHAMHDSAIHFITQAAKKVVCALGFLQVSSLYTRCKGLMVLFLLLLLLSEIVCMCGCCCHPAAGCIGVVS